MTCMRLESADTDISRRTIELTKFVPKQSMSGAEKNSNISQSAASKSLELRQEYFRSKQA